MEHEQQKRKGRFHPKGSRGYHPYERLDLTKDYVCDGPGCERCFKGYPVQDHPAVQREAEGLGSVFRGPRSVQHDRCGYDDAGAASKPLTSAELVGINERIEATLRAARKGSVGVFNEGYQRNEEEPLF